MATQFVTIDNLTVNITSYLNGGGSSVLTGANLTRALYDLNKFDGLVKGNISASLGSGSNKIAFTKLAANPTIPVGPTVKPLITGLTPSYFYDASSSSTAVNLVMSQTTNQTFLIVGGSGDDTIGGALGVDSLYGGDGNDFVSYAFVNAAVSVNLATGAVSGGGGVDIIDSFEGVIGSSASDTLTGSSGNDTLLGGLGADTLVGAQGVDLLDGGAGVADVADFSSAANATLSVALGATDTGITLTLNGSTASTVTAGSTDVGADTVKNIEYIVGTAGKDTITGDGSSNSITGGTGADTLSGLAGNDTLVGGAGNDSLVGGDGNDTFSVVTADSSDTIIGGNGNDTISVGSTIVFDATDANISGVEFVTLTAASSVTLLGQTEAFTITGSTAADTIIGGLGADVIDGGTGNDAVVYTGATLTGTGGITLALTGANFATVTAGSTNVGADRIRNVENVTGTTGDDSISGDSIANSIAGGNGNDILQGGGGNDTITGDAGNDTITGGAGADSLTGGAGSDTFVFTTASNSNSANAAAQDTITDLTLNGSSGDLLDFTLTGALTVLTGTSTAANFAAFDSISEINAIVNSANGSASVKFTGGSSATALLLTLGGTSSKALVVDINGDGAFTAVDVAINVTGVTATSFTTACFV